ncbi:hypothetical protein ABT392_19575 [Paucibacter sp. JuS9]|uniref:hypothetical protein n=1 Tax=Paucibacter sp. JuS9 TaxID=3228748 RepID=UPI00375813BD
MAGRLAPPGGRGARGAGGQRVLSLRRLGRRAWVWLALLVLACLALWLLRGRAEPATRHSLDGATGPSTFQTQDVAASSSGQAWALLNEATLQADAASNVLVLDAAELQRLDQADCARMGPALQKLEPGALPGDEVSQWDADAREHDAWLRRWIIALRQRGDERSLAALDFLDPLLAREDLERRNAASQRLNQRALRSSDGFVLALAAQRPCLPGMGCSQTLPRQRWAQMEPGNLSAWLAAVPSEQPLPETWLNGVMQATHDNSHRAELMSMLLSLPPELPPGPRRLARDLALFGISTSLEVPQFAPLIRYCRAGNDAQRCRAMAGKLWALREPSLLNWSLTLALARQSPPLDPHWESRSRQVEAARQWATSDALASAVEPMILAFQCKPAQDFERQTLGRLLEGEGPMLLAEMQRAGADMASLSKQFRQANGRSLLEPGKPSAAAAGASR